LSNVPTNLIPTRITGLPDYTGTSTLGYFAYALEGRTYKVQFSQLAAVGAVPSTRVIGTGNGLEGGGDLSQNRVISIIPHGVGYSQLDFTGVTAGTYGSADTVPSLTIDATGRVTAAVNTPIVLSNYVPSSRTVTAGAGLTGGGQLNNNITIALNPSNATPQSLGAASAGTGTQAARDDHVHPAVDLTDTSETQGVLPLGRGGTGVALSPVVGAVIYADNDSLNQTVAGNAGQILKSAGGLGAPYWDDLLAGGTVTSVSVITANGFAGTVANSTTTPAITLTTTVTGLVKANGSALSAAVAGTDYIAPGAITTSGLTMATARLLGRTTASSGAVEEITVGTGLSLSVGSLTNTAPDQVVSLTGGTAISISGTYPSFTITNTAPDQIVSLTGAGTTVVTGTYPSFTITSSDQYGGTVTSVSVVTANGFAGTVANASTTPAITLTTSVSGLVKGNGTALSAAIAGTDYVAPGAYTSSGLTMATARLLGRTTASSGAAEEITVGTGLSLSAGSLTNSAPDQTVVLTGAGTTVVTGTYPNFTITSNDQYTGTVTSVGLSGGTTGLTVSGTNPITTSGTFTLGGTLAIANGGTNGSATPTAGGIAYGTGTAYAFSSAGTAGQFLTSTGGGTPTWSTASSPFGNPAYWGSFWDTTDQAAAAANTAYVVTLNSADPSNNGTTVVSGSRVTFAHAGIYSLTFSIQFMNTDTQIHDVNVWMRKNGTNIPDSDTKLSIQNKHGGVNGYGLMTVNFVFSLAAGDYIEMVWAATDTSISIQSEPAGTTPVTPSIPGVIFTAVSAPHIGIGYAGVASTTSMTIGTGSKTFTTNVSSTDTAFTVGNRVRLIYDATNYMEGTITAFSGTSMTVNVDTTAGSGTYATWSVGLTGVVNTGVTSFSGGSTGLTPNTATSGAVTLAGTLGVGYGGTGTATAFTAGSVVFAGASGVYSQDNASLFWDDSNNRLGIGNTAPGYKLEVTGDLRLGGGGDLRLGSATGTTTSAGDSSIYNDANDLYLNTNNVTRMYIANGGNVGIGNTGPTYRLDVSSADTTANLGYAMRIRANATAGGGTFQFTDSGATAQWGFLAATATSVTLDATNASILAFRTNNSERARISSGGLFGIGTSSPQVGLHVSFADQSTNRVRLQNTGSGGGNFDIVGGNPGASNAGLAFFDVTNSATRMYIDSSGNFGIGTTSPNYKLEVFGSPAWMRNFAGTPSSPTETQDWPVSAFNVASFGDFTLQTMMAFTLPNDGNYFTGYSVWNFKLDQTASSTTSSGVAGMQFGGPGYLAFMPGTSEKARITSGGFLLVGTTTPMGGNTSNEFKNTGAGAWPLTLNSNDRGLLVRNSAAGSGFYAYFEYNGGTNNGSISWSGGTTAYNTGSDYRLKEVDGPITNSGAYIDALNPVQGRWKADGTRFIGLIAHEVQEVSETPVATGVKDGEQMQMMDYSSPEIIGNMIAELKSLRARVAQLEGK
jgi:hypothetical protein